jgi:23S rRNA (pseudouridine1915-N3)-methyltransferase
MKTQVWAIGKTNEKYLQKGCAIYEQRLKHYLPFEFTIVPDVRQAGKLSAAQLKQKEAELIFKQLRPEDQLVLLDEKGKNYTSEALARRMDKWQQMSKRRLIFLIGGAYGFDESLYERADAQLSLSAMTFSHQMIRLFLLEQLYRAMTILRNEPYHNP